MKTGNELDQVVYGYWAKRFGCDRQDFVHSGTLVIKEEELAGTGKIYLYHIDRMSIVRADPSLAKQAGLQEGYDRDSGSLSVPKLQALVPVEVDSTFLDYYLDAKDFKCFTARGDFTTRRLYAENDNPYLQSLYEACTEGDLDEAAINVDEPDPVIYGMFDGDQLVAYASHRYWEDVIADIGVLIHPGYRGRGLGKAVVSALCEWCIGSGVVPMYRVFSYNDHSCNLAQALGFNALVVIETLKVVKEESTS
ncbi:MAG: GNAT family N-acetyltransferase [Chloroflexi bacterium]|nr:MAG: GNAT family N-acetyltransferase [Chloroflexota bacterium]